MKGTRAAIRYAKAILDLAKDQNTAPAVNDDMKLITNTIADNKELKSLLNSPVVKAAQKTAVLKDVFANTNAITTGLVDVLVENKRLTLLEAVATEYTSLFEASQGFQKAHVTTAVPLTDDMNAKVLAKVKELTGKEALIENTIDESILGGFI
ncbi:MAG: ATP synthase F1 subunit delta, partial [Flavobacteriaceae bacterium]